jgi:bacterioferritin-associated ferredoxin
MNQKCDRCGRAVRALYRVARRGELHLCGHCARQLRPVLSAQGWTIWPVAAQALEHAN